MSKISESVKNGVRKRAMNSCEKCGDKILRPVNKPGNGSFHHRLPQRLGGKHTRSNLVLICLGCHKDIHDDEFVASLTGWIAWTDPDVTPVLRQGRGRGPGWALLVPDGTLEHLTHREGERLCIYVNWCLQAS